MAYWLISTTAIQVLNARVPVTVVLHAPTTNSGVIQWSTTDPLVSNPENELTAGQDVSFDNWSGSVYVKGSATGQNLGVTAFPLKKGGTVIQT